MAYKPSANQHPAGTTASRQLSLREFLETDDLSILEGRQLEAEKNESFKSFLQCGACCVTLFSWGLAPLLAPSMCYVDSIHSGAYLNLNKDAVEFSQPTPSCCVLAATQRQVRLENITDVTIHDDCFMRLFGLKKLIVQTAGTGGVGDANTLSGIQAVFLLEPEMWKSAISHAQQLKRQELAAPQSQSMSRGPMSKLLQSRAAQLRELSLRGVLQCEEGDVTYTAALVSDDPLPLKLLALSDLVDAGGMKRATLDAAVQLAVSRWAGDGGAAAKQT